MVRNEHRCLSFPRSARPYLSTQSVGKRGFQRRAWEPGKIAEPHWLPLAVSARREFVMVRPGIAVGLFNRVRNRRRKSFVHYSFSFKPKKKGFVL